MSIPLDFVPSNEQELAKCLEDPMWRLGSGQLYKIIVKEAENEEEGLVMPFKPNRQQRRLIKKLWYRNIILKARQLGMTTFIAIYFLDCVLFGKKNTRAGIIAHTEKAAKAIFRDKVKFAYNNLPEVLREAMPLVRDSAEELLFEHNNSSIQVSTSLRSGTYQLVHVSEFGKICAKHPDRAEEVITGTLPTVTPTGIVFIESTAEGRTGHFFTMTSRAMNNALQRKKLSRKEYRFHFYAWWQAEEYRTDPEGIHISREDHLYFDEVEQKIGRKLDDEQRAWYVSTRDNDFSGEDSKMWQEHPSTPDEPFKVNTAGAYFRVQMIKVRKERRICRVPLHESYPVSTFWDIGSGDGTGIWLIQKVGQQYRALKYIEEWGESYNYFVRQLQDYQMETGCVWGQHFLPHDGNHVRQGKDNNSSPKEILEELGLKNVEIVPQISELSHGIQATREVLAHCWFDEEGCKEGIDHLDQYAKKWNSRTERYMDAPDKDAGHSEAADSFRQFAQAVKAGDFGQVRKTKVTRKRRSARTI